MPQNSEANITSLFLNATPNILHGDRKPIFDPTARAWRRIVESAQGGAPIFVADAARWLQKDSGRPVRTPVPIVGYSALKQSETILAKEVGAAFAKLEVATLCGGLDGLVILGARGTKEAGGFALGLLSDTDWRNMPPYLTHVLAAGPGSGRSTMIADAGLGLVAIGGSEGTLAEMAHALRFKRRMLAFSGTSDTAGAQRFASVKDIVETIVGIVLNICSTETPWR